MVPSLTPRCTSYVLGHCDHRYPYLVSWIAPQKLLQRTRDRRLVLEHERCSSVPRQAGWPSPKRPEMADATLIVRVRFHHEPAGMRGADGNDLQTLVS